LGLAHLFAVEGCSGTVKNTPTAHQYENLEKAKKRRFTESAVTPTCDVFRCSKLDTGGSVARRIFLWEEVVQGRSRYVHFNLTSQKTQKKGESLNQPLLQRTTLFDAQIWTRGGGWSGASFCGRGLFRDGQKNQLHVNVKLEKKLRKRRITKSAVTQTYGGFRRSILDTVVGWGWRIFLWEGVVQGRSKMGRRGQM